LERQWWTLRRFGLTPQKLPHRLLNRTQPRVFCNSLPKSGTHLLERALCLHPALYRHLYPTIHEGNIDARGGLDPLLAHLRPGEILVAHLARRSGWDDAVARAEARGLIMLRDPRDIAVSMSHYTLAETTHPWHSHYASLPSLHDRIRLTICGNDVVAPLRVLLKGYADWSDAGALTVRFEDLVGPEGGGDEVRQVDTLRGIYAHLGVPLDDAGIDRVRHQLFSKRSPTFRRGTIGQWRAVFDAELSDLFEREARELLDACGYP
jgi:hypothetical protein